MPVRLLKHNRLSLLFFLTASEIMTISHFFSFWPSVLNGLKLRASISCLTIMVRFFHPAVGGWQKNHSFYPVTKVAFDSLHLSTTLIMSASKWYNFCGRAFSFQQTTERICHIIFLPSPVVSRYYSMSRLKVFLFGPNNTRLYSILGCARLSFTLLEALTPNRLES